MLTRRIYGEQATVGERILPGRSSPWPTPRVLGPVLRGLVRTHEERPGSHSSSIMPGGVCPFARWLSSAKLEKIGSNVALNPSIGREGSKPLRIARVGVVGPAF